MINLKQRWVWQNCMICHYWYLKGVGFKFKSNICNVVLDVSVQNQRRIEILNVNGVDCGCILSGTSRNKSVNILNNSM